MELAKRYNAVINELLSRLTLMENSGVSYAGLGPAITLEILFESFAGCTLCPRHSERLSFAKINWGRGAVRAELAFVSDNEIADEASRALLEKMITAMGLSPRDVYITSIVKCNTKNPDFSMEEALSSCKALLLRELELVSPQVVVALGEQATKVIVDTPLAFESIRGRFQEGATPRKAPFQIMPTHPLELLVGNKDRKKESWGDLKKVMSKLKLTPAK